jgi:radical SAM superfamily enzyme YgiQ (UPF0313 family)
MKNILLVNPRSTAAAPGALLSSKSMASKQSPFEGMIPLSLATIAALTPEEFEVDIWDEAVNGVITPDSGFDKEYALVGVTGYFNHSKRINELGQLFRRRGALTVVGGSGVSSDPEWFRDSFDVCFIGEAEYTWPRFISDWQEGSYRSEYRQVGKVDMAFSPRPKWDKFSLGAYFMGAVQTTRGCPFDCEFCDVIYIFGRQVRQKPIEQVLEEVRELERRGTTRVLFCDDNFMGNPRYTRDLLKRLKRLNNSFRRPMSFYTQISVNLANDDELLELMADSNFLGVLVGIESPNIESLIEINKSQNYKTDLVAAVEKIHSYGLAVQNAMIVGFDNDDASIFDRHFEFIQQTGLTIPYVNILKAARGTPLWARLQKEGRVFQFRGSVETFRPEYITNVMPKQMTLEQLLSGYIDLIERIRDWDNFEARVKTMLSQINRRPRVKSHSSWREALAYIPPLASMNGKARWVVARLLLHTWRRAPFMIETVAGISLIQYLDAANLPLMKESIGAWIRDLVGEDGAGWEREPAVFTIPEEFKKPYKAIFPELHERLYQGLVDRTRTQEALVKVILDFLTRWGPSFQRFEDHHRVFLNELCDRTIAAENRNHHAGAGPASPAPREESAAPGAPRSVLPRGLSDDVLHFVEQDLRSFQPA